MRFTALLIALAIFIPSGAMAGSYGQRSYPVRIIAKSFRGLVNVAASPIEIWVNSYKEARSADVAGANLNGVVVGYSTGVITGIGYMFTRIGVGLYDLVTFPVPSDPLMMPATPAFMLEWMTEEKVGEGAGGQGMI